MVKKLEVAIAEVSKLSSDEQEAIASWLLDELAAERSWLKSFAKSQDKLKELATRALAEFKRAETRPLEKDRDLADD